MDYNNSLFARSNAFKKCHDRQDVGSSSYVILSQPEQLITRNTHTSHFGWENVIKLMMVLPLLPMWQHPGRVVESHSTVAWHSERSLSLKLIVTQPPRRIKYVCVLPPDKPLIALFHFHYFIALHATEPHKWPHEYTSVMYVIIMMPLPQCDSFFVWCSHSHVTGQQGMYHIPNRKMCPRLCAILVVRCDSCDDTRIRTSTFNYLYVQTGAATGRQDEGLIKIIK